MDVPYIIFLDGARLSIILHIKTGKMSINYAEEHKLCSDRLPVTKAPMISKML